MKKQSRKILSWSVDTLSRLKRHIEDEQVGNTAKAATQSKPATPPVRHSVNKDKDEDFFLKAMSDVKEMPEFRALSHLQPKAARPENRGGGSSGVHRHAASRDLDEELLSLMSGSSGVDISQTDEYIQGYGPDVRPDLCEAMHAGQIPAQDSLDMHGLTLDEARPALEAFIRQARNRGLRCVNIIHGRGLRSPAGPVLKEAVRSWMDSGPLRKLVMAYATAPPSDGGPGATYLLLR